MRAERLEDEVVVVVHEAVGVAEPVVAVGDAPKGVEQERVIAVVFEDGALNTYNL
jgi:hypothetical protein